MKPHAKVIVALAISVALNLFLLGFGVAHWLTLRGHGVPGELRAGAPWVLHGRHFRELLRSHRDELAPRVNAIRSARRAALESLGKEPFDREELRTRLDALRETTTQAQTEIHELLLEAAQTMTPEERQRLADAQRRGPGERRERHGNR